MFCFVFVLFFYLLLKLLKFLSVVALGMWIVLNLFLAILLDAFDKVDEEEEDEKSKRLTLGLGISSVNRIIILFMFYLCY